MVILSCSALQRWEGNFRANLWVYPELRLSLVLSENSRWFSNIFIQNIQTPRHFTTSLLQEDARLQVFQPLCIRLPYNQLWKCPSVHATLLDAISDVAKKTGKLLQSLDWLWFYDDLCMYYHVFICFHMYSTKLSSQSNHWTLIFDDLWYGCESWSLCLDPKGLQRRPVREFRSQKPASKIKQATSNGNFTNI